MEVFDVPDEASMRRLGGKLVTRWRPGDLVFLEGPLGAGKTTLVRGIIESLGIDDPVRSPTYNLIQTFGENLMIMHADLYRVTTWQGIGIEDYLETHLCLIEWPDRAVGLVLEGTAWTVQIEFAESGRRVHVGPPASAGNARS